LKIEQVQSSEFFDTVAERVTYNFPTSLPAGSKAELRIGFGGKLTGGMAGYYKSSWELDGRTKSYALTQFEASLQWIGPTRDSLKILQPTAARRAFPCWDEPLLKATFAITLISRVDTVNLSNMPAISEDIYTPENKISGGGTALADLLASMTIENDGWKITRFQTTPPMSSYIVAFANGPFEYLEKSVTMPLSGKTLPLRIYGM
jgi:aminopeptidase 2